MWELLDKRMKGKANTNWFDKNKQNIVPWRPKKGIHLLNKDLKELWYEEITNTDYMWLVKLLMNMTEDDMKKAFDNKDQYIIMKILISNMTDKNKNFEVLEKITDRVFWKSVQKIQATSVNVNINPLDDRLKELWLS